MPSVRRKVFAAALVHAVDQRNELVSTQSQIEVILVFLMLLMDVFFTFFIPLCTPSIWMMQTMTIVWSQLDIDRSSIFWRFPWHHGGYPIYIYMCIYIYIIYIYHFLGGVLNHGGYPISYHPCISISVGGRRSPPSPPPPWPPHPQPAPQPPQSGHRKWLPCPKSLGKAETIDVSETFEAWKIWGQMLMPVTGKFTFFNSMIIGFHLERTFGFLSWRYGKNRDVPPVIQPMMSNSQQFRSICLVM